ncbi:hypothetical protein BMF94_0973 [Rhodotorula taiwanensis]|uniref:Laccase n=1 Tax=Rhodotorula taiwanensis TaxID=741276 RepID=A0A2S5BGJ3_9BASI|nr:hypothetical protein BMF94_0973 [Rhodotorula taiwanensis]
MDTYKEFKQQADDSASALDDVASLSQQQPTERRTRSRRRRAAAVATALLLVAVALGVGLGVGLRHRKSVADDASATIAPTSQRAPLAVQTPPESNFVLKGQTAMSAEAPTTRYYDFVVQQRDGAPDGFNKSMLVVNGMYPGPTIEANVDDRIVVNVTNLLPNATTIHWHGLYQRGTPWYDGTNAITQCGIPPGASMIYNFTLSGWYGSTWWHSHYSTQYTDGISGAIVIHNRTQELAEPVDGELSIQLSDLYHRFSTDLLHQYLSRAGMTGQGLEGVTQGNEPVPDAGTINGVGQWGNYTSAYSNYTLGSNSTYRLRLANTGSFAAASFSVDDHPLIVVEADGVLVEPYQVSSLTIDVAQRYSVLLRTNQTAGAYWMRYTVSQDAFTYTENGGSYDIRGVLRYGVGASALPVDSATGADLSLQSMDTSRLVPAEAQNPPPANNFYTFSLSMQNTADNHWLAFVNSTSWSPLQGQATLLDQWAATTRGASTNDSQLIVTIPDANETQVVQVVYNNLDDGDHPFHLHGYKFFIMGQGAGRYTGQALNEVNPMRRDTALFPAYTYAVIRFIADNPFNILPQAQAALLENAPPVLQEQCATIRSLNAAAAA